jgi:alkanesulfonate monooxygenase SsuD/methylene tetrahydromethanopterin reductase-like flavin-dependent oxidoreductase (luciferase family)
MTMAEARERNDEIVADLDAALTDRVISHQGEYFSFSDLRLLPRPLQQPSPPRWTAIVSPESARRAAQRAPGGSIDARRTDALAFFHALCSVTLSAG